MLKKPNQYTVMKSPLRKLYYLHELTALVAIMTLAVAGILTWFAAKSYQAEQEKIKTIFSTESARLEKSFIDTIDHTQAVMRMIITQIKPNHEDTEYISSILSKYRPNPNIVEALTWTVFSWANSAYHITVDSVAGVMPIPYDLSNRDYVPLTRRYPDVIQLGNPVYGSTSKKWMIPAGVGAIDETGQYIGAMTIGFDIANLAAKLKYNLKSEGVDFALIDRNGHVILQSSEMLEEFAKRRIANTHLRELFNAFIQGETVSPYSETHLLPEKNTNNFFLYKISGYPYYLYLKYDQDLLRLNLWHALTSRFVEVVVIAAVALLLLVLIYIREKRLRSALQDANEHLEENVRARTFDLEKALKIKTDFLNNLSHEVRTPVQGVIGFSAALVESWHEWEEEERFRIAEKLRYSADRLFGLINVLLDISKFESGRMSFEMKEHNMLKLINDIVTECESLILNKPITIEITNTADTIYTECDSTRISQVIRNLLANAIKFMPSGTIRIQVAAGKIQYEDRRKVDGLSITVCDEGVGIPADELTEIFNPFSQSSRTNKGLGGTGLGLSISRQIIEAHHGRIWAENNRGKGASVTFVIPYSQKQKERVKVKKPMLLPSLIRKKLPSQVIIVMIDNETVCLEAISLILGNYQHYKLLTVQGGAEGIKFIRGNAANIDIIMLGMALPNSQGLEILEAIQAQADTAHIPVIISGLANETELIQASRLGAVSTLQKPYEPLMVIGAIEIALGKKKKAA